MRIWGNSIELKPSKSGVYTETVRLFKLLSVDAKYPEATYKIITNRVFKVFILLKEFGDFSSASSITRKIKHFNTTVQHKDEK